ncbi:unnamed protein product [Tenebrio molitor]|jgi:NADH dehydrogenase (ubiquinone) 1 alpha subcomplex subunit 1|nr:unnamed protein product [Tenebrio molitor]
MWYQIIPGFMIIAVCLAVPHYIAYPMNWLVTGHMYRRSIMDKHEALQYLRDLRLEDPYKIKGLENIPDEDEDDENCDEEENGNGNNKK